MSDSHRGVIPWLAASVGFAAALFTGCLVDRLFFSRLVPPATSFPPPMPPSTRVEFQTSEFHWFVRTNRLGLREREIPLVNTSGYRVLAIGDSFTLGWGVDADRAWPTLLESEIRATRHDVEVEVINAGMSGKSTSWYAQAAEQMVPVLHPDLVIVGIVQGDDLAQAFEQAPALSLDRPLTGTPLKRAGKLFVRAAAPNFTRWWQLGGSFRTAVIQGVWRDEAASFVSQMNAGDRDRFDKLDPAAGQMFREGNLNPGLLAKAIAEPDRLRMTFHQAEEQTRTRLEVMTRHIERIREVCDREGAQVVVCAIPYGPFVSRRQRDTVNRIGFNVEDDFLTSDAPDDVIRTACEQAHVDFLSVTHVFRDIGDQRQLYFDWDGHFNEDGHRLFAESIRSAIALRVAGRTEAPTR